MLVSAVQSSTDLVVLQSDALCVKEDGVASVAMQHLQMLGLQLTNTLAGCTNQKVLECKVKYEQKVKTLLAFSSEELGKQNIAKCKQELLRDEIFDQMKERMEREQKHVSIQKMQQVIIETFQTEIDRINSTFPDQLKSYIDQTGKQLAEALSEKEKMCREQSEFFLQKLSAMEEFLNKTSKAIPSYSLYGESCHLMLRQANDFSERKEDLINQLRSLVKPEGLLNEIQKKIEEVSAKILLNKDKALSHLHEEIDKLSKGKSKDSKLKQIEGYIDILQEANSIYVEQTDHYLDLVSHSVNELVAGVQAEMTLALKLQDENLIQLTTKSQALSGFLEYQTKKVLELVQEHQKPIISREVGAALGRLFDDRSDVAHGRIAKINIWSNYFINKLEVIYEDATGRQTVGMQGGVTKAELEDRFVKLVEGIQQPVIELGPQERIIRIDIGTGAFSEFSNKEIWDKMECIQELTIYTSEGRQFGPFGGRGSVPPWERSSANPLHALLYSAVSEVKIQTIEFGSDYYLGAFAGRSDYFVRSLSFVFFKNFAPLLQKDLSDRIVGVLELAKENPECKLSAEETVKIRDSFAQMSYVDLTKQNDPYAILKISPSASTQEISKAYKALCLQYHPDKVTEEWKRPLYKLKFHEIQQAYESLKVPGE